MIEQALPPMVERPWLGMLEDPYAPHPKGMVNRAQNLYLEGGVWKGRPGTDNIGSLGASRVQGFFSFEGLDGTLYTGAFCGGDIHFLDWSTLTWTTVDLSVQGVALSSSTAVRSAALRGKLVFTDGVNTPGQWDPATDSYTQLTAAPVAGDMTIYYSKVFFGRKPTNLSDFEWSIEGDATDGYAALNNAWTFGQTDQGAVSKLLGENERLLVFKQDSISSIRGAANDQFKSYGTREGISETEGALGPGCVIPAGPGGDVFYLSQYGVRALQQGSRHPVEVDVLPLGDSEHHLISETWGAVNRDYWHTSLAAYDPVRQHVLFAVPTVGSALDTIICYAVRPRAFSIFTGLTPTAMQTVEALDGEEYVLVGDANGNVLRYGGAVGSDAGTAIEHLLESQHYWQDVGRVRKRLTRLDLIFDPPTSLTNAETTPVTDGVDGVTRTFSEDALDPQEKYTRGLNALGYRVGWRFRHAAVGETVELVEADTEGTMADDPVS